ncbi:MAG: LPS export ABC transporter periplasmic protein LptC [Pseudomonadota bacterium]
MDSLRERIGIGGFILLVGAIVIGVAILFSEESPRGDDAVQADDADFEADLVASGVEYDQLNPDGTLNYKLIADSIVQYPEADQARSEHTDLVEPKFQLNSPDEPPWNINARQGKLARAEDPQKPGEEVLFLEDDVVMVQSHPERGNLRISSDSFAIYPHREYAQTDEAVIIDSEFGRTEAAGMKANLTTGLLKLVSENGRRVHTLVLPENFKNSETTDADEDASS